MSNASLLALWPTVAAARAAILFAIEDVTEEQALRHPVDQPDQWCVLQVMQHVLGWTTNVDEVIEAVAAGRVTAKHPRGYLPPNPPQTLAEARRALLESSLRFLALPTRVAEVANAEMTVAHEVYGDLNYHGWFARCAAHDGDHHRQIEALTITF